jgi:RNA polymerase sigma factor (sigma-70 family)
VKTWLYRIAVKQCLAAGRHQGRRVTLAQRHQRRIMQNAHSDPTMPPEEVLAQEQERHQVWRALRRLTAYARTLMILRYHEGLTTCEIASVLQVSTRTVERHVRRAQAQFQLAYERGMQHAVPQRRTTTPVVRRTLPGVIERVRHAGLP